MDRLTEAAQQLASMRWARAVSLEARIAGLLGVADRGQTPVLGVEAGLDQVGTLGGVLLAQAGEVVGIGEAESVTVDAEGVGLEIEAEAVESNPRLGCPVPDLGPAQMVRSTSRNEILVLLTVVR